MVTNERSAARACRYAALVVVCLLGATLQAASGVGSKDRDAVGIRRVPGPGYVSLIVENRRAYDVTVELTIQGQNARVTRLLPETETVPGGSQIAAVRLSPADPDRPWRWHFRFRWTKGSIHATHDEKTLYRLPFDTGRSCRVSQAYRGRLSHRGPNRYAVDFAMREGTTVCAAREGIVVDLKESSDTGGPSRRFEDKANYVSIAHADGTIGEYHHLKQDGVLVEIGDRITAGQPIALSGNTGFSTLPHLHFGVYSALDAEHLQSHPITFATRRGLVPEPQEGASYTAR